MVAEYTRKIIRGAGVKQKFIAQKAGYTEREFSDMLAGRKLIRDEDILRISQALGVTPNELFGIPDTSEQEG